MRYLTTLETQDGSVTPAAYAQARWHELGGSFPTQTSLRLMAGELDQDGHSFRATLPQLSPVVVNLTAPELAAVQDLMGPSVGPRYINGACTGCGHNQVRHSPWDNGDCSSCTICWYGGPGPQAADSDWHQRSLQRCVQVHLGVTHASWRAAKVAQLPADDATD